VDTGHVVLIDLNGFSSGGLWSGSEGRHRSAYLAPVPETRYRDAWDEIVQRTRVANATKSAPSGPEK